jgi:hypothetical protein
MKGVEGFIGTLVASRAFLLRNSIERLMWDLDLHATPKIFVA